MSENCDTVLCLRAYCTLPRSRFRLQRLLSVPPQTSYSTPVRGTAKVVLSLVGLDLSEAPQYTGKHPHYRLHLLGFAPTLHILLHLQLISVSSATPHQFF